MSRSPRSRRRPVPVATLFLTALLAAGAGSAGAAEVEVREYRVRVDAQPAGQCQVTFHRRDDGTLALEGQTDVRVKYLVYTYAYTYRGTELWKDGRLLSLESTTVDDGRRSAVSARAEGESLLLKTSTYERALRPDVCPTTYWSLPAGKLRGQTVPFLDADGGQELSGVLQFVAQQQLSVGGEVQNCVHYRVVGEARADLWFDARERLVRQEYYKDGRRIAWELVRVRR